VARVVLAISRQVAVFMTIDLLVCEGAAALTLIDLGGPAPV
jgi:hypothetical protein